MAANPDKPKSLAEHRDRVAQLRRGLAICREHLNQYVDNPSRAQFDQCDYPEVSMWKKWRNARRWGKHYRRGFEVARSAVVSAEHKLSKAEQALYEAEVQAQKAETEQLKQKLAQERITAIQVIDGRGEGIRRAHQLRLDRLREHHTAELKRMNLHQLEAEIQTLRNQLERERGLLGEESGRDDERLQLLQTLGILTPLSHDTLTESTAPSSSPLQEPPPLPQNQQNPSS